MIERGEDVEIGQAEASGFWQWTDEAPLGGHSFALGVIQVVIHVRRGGYFVV